MVNPTPTPTAAIDSVTAQLRLGDLSVTFGARRVLSGVSMTAGHGEVCGILGPNGAGKTTLLRAALGLVPYEGSVRLGGVELNALSALTRAKQVAYVPQRSLLTAALSVQEVVGQGRYAHEPSGSRRTAADRDAMVQAMADCDLLGFEQRRFTQLSGGEQRRVLLARALATAAPLILLDEPTAALDIPHALAFCDLVRRLADTGRSIVVVLHNLDEAARMCDRVVLLRRGQVHGAGPAKEWISEEPVRDVFGVTLVRNGGFAFELPATPASEVKQ